MTIKTSHGKFRFSNQRFADNTGERRFTWLGYTAQCRESYESERLRSRCCYYANRMSYREVAKLLFDETGRALVSSQRIHDIVEEEAQRLSGSRAARARDILESGEAMPAINQQVAIYDTQSEEVLIFDDGIQVKKQKEVRDKPPSQESEIALQGQARVPGSAQAHQSPSGLKETAQKPRPTKKPKEKVTTDVMMLQRAQGGFTYIMEGITGNGDEHMNAEALVQSEIINEYGERTDALNIVAITDGARNIRLFLERVFGVVIMIILDWYHLEKKVWELMSMIAWNRTEKNEHCRALLSWLWHGNVKEALEYLTTSVSPRNKKKHQELITYLTKHKTEIINYQARKEAGKPIGSGRIEKGVDQVIGQRQKDQGMSWSEMGSKSLGILKIHELNEHIEEPGLLLAA